MESTTQQLSAQLTPCPERIVVGRARTRLTIGIVGESATEETRIPLTPQGVEVLTAQGHRVVMERGAGLESRFADDRYAQVGAEIVDSRSVALGADIVVKVSPPTESDAEKLRAGQTVICLIGRHRRDKRTFSIMASKRTTLIAADFITDSGMGDEPQLAASLGEIEGMTAIGTASHLLQQADGGKGIMLGGITGVPPTEIVIIGSDASAWNAARAGVSLGCNVKVFDTDFARLRRLANHLPMHIFTSVLHPQALTKALRSADVIIACREQGGKRGYVIPSEYLELVKRGAVVVDLDNLNGGRTEWTRTTSLAEPTYVHNTLRYHCLPDLTATVPHTASIVLSDILTPALSSIGDEGGIAQALRFRPTLRSGASMWQGKVTNRYLAQTIGTEYFDIRLLLP